MIVGRLFDFQGSDEEYIAYLEAFIQINLANQQPNNTGRPEAGALSTHDRQRKRQLVEGRGSATDLDDAPTFIEWSPGEATISTIKPPKRKRHTEETWRARADRLLAMTPAAESWCKTVQNLGIASLAGRRLLDSGVLRAATNRGDCAQERQVLSRLEQFAKTTMELSINAKFAIMLANFQKFVLLSACAVLYYDDATIDKKRIFHIIALSRDSILSEVHCVKILTAVKHINRLVFDLGVNGWGSRATELLLIWNEDPVSYVALNSSPRNSMSYLYAQLTSPKYLGDIAPTVQYDVARYVHDLLGEELSLPHIYKLLDIEHTQLTPTSTTRRSEMVAEHAETATLIARAFPEEEIQSHYPPISTDGMSCSTSESDALNPSLEESGLIDLMNPFDWWNWDVIDASISVLPDHRL